MNVLHVWDQASVACVLAKWQRKLGHNAYVLKRIVRPELGITEYYNEKVIRSLMPRFLLSLWWHATRADIIHVHDAFSLIPFLRGIRKPIIYHYHGTPAYKNPPSKRRAVEQRADFLALATPDLLNLEYARPVQYIPNPVDTDLFRPAGHAKNNNGLLILKANHDSHVIWHHVQQKLPDVNWYAIMRTDMPVPQGVAKCEPQPYRNMPDTLRKFEFFADIQAFNTRNHTILPMITMTGLQALACGLQVLTHDGIQKGLPACHQPEHAAQAWCEIYERLIAHRR